MRHTKLTTGAIALALVAASASNTRADDDATAALDLQAKQIAVQKAQVDLEAAKAALVKTELVPPGSGTSGAVATTTGAGSAEELVLSQSAADELAKDMANGIMTACEQSTAAIVVLVGDDKRTLADAVSYDLTRDRISHTLENALELTKEVDQPPGGERAFLGGLGIAGVVSLSTAVLSYFRSDYSIGGGSIDADQEAFANLLASRLNGRSVYFPADFTISVDSPIVENVKGDLSKFDSQAALLTGRVNAIGRQIKGLADSKDPKDKAESDRLARLQTVASSAVEAYNTFANGLLAVDAKGGSSLQRVAQEKALFGGDHCAVEIKLSKMAGSTLTVKNFWSGFGSRIPFYVSGTVVGTYRVLDRHGKTVTSNTFTRSTRLYRIDGGVKDAAPIPRSVGSATK